MEEPGCFAKTIGAIVLGCLLIAAPEPTIGIIGSICVIGIFLRFFWFIIG